ncbi:hypothetical protein LT493_04275 [Streptomyces tricolor]|nr:hypothetical protein [Streptomyces tricolor]
MLTAALVAALTLPAQLVAGRHRGPARRTTVPRTGVGDRETPVHRPGLPGRGSQGDLVHRRSAQRRQEAHRRRRDVRGPLLPGVRGGLGPYVVLPAGGPARRQPGRRAVRHTRHRPGHDRQLSLHTDAPHGHPHRVTACYLPEQGAQVCVGGRGGHSASIEDNGNGPAPVGRWTGP